MKMEKFPEANVVYARDQPQYQPLPAYRWRDQRGRITACWSLSILERIVVLFTGTIWHDVLTFNEPLQPQLLSVQKPKLPEPEAREALV